MAHISNLEQATALDIEKWLQTLPEEAPAYAFSEKYKKFRVKLFDKMRGEKYHRFTKRATVAIIVAAILFAMAVATLAATLGKDFILKHFNGYSTFEISDSKENAEYVNGFVLNYIPDGFNKIDEDSSEMGITYSYKNGNFWFNISKSFLNSGGGFSSENGIKTIEKNGINYLILSEENSNTVMWNDGKYYYDMNGTLPKEELLKIAQGAR